VAGRLIGPHYDPRMDTGGTELATVLAYGPNLLGLCLEADGRAAEAEAAWLRCVDVRELHGLSDLIGSPVGNLGKLTSHHDRYAEALCYPRGGRVRAPRRQQRPGGSRSPSPTSMRCPFSLPRSEET
jgi:hypothetical protein